MNIDYYWYNNLKKSILTPPNYIFSIIWPILYISIFYSFYLYIKTKNTIVNLIPIYLFILQLLLNLLWPIIFFRYKKIFDAYNIIICLIILVYLIIFNFKKINKTASNLLLPYLTWLHFALYLNYYIIKNNNINIL